MAVQAQNLSYRAFFEHETSRMLFEGALPVDIERIFAQVEEEGAWIKSWKTLGASEEQKAKEAKKAVFKKQHILDIYMPLIVTGWPNTIYYRIFLKNRSFYH
ncbi:hypothetical protein CO110_07080 [Candidatus Desantisbacteria bacterium CG_4_9_14_3_um_filter_40_11]|uniref:Uncharacterized protein n=3 Tax=unclassified Candidatus Desantisiibacteriota TaxID=3106372 RepID=A0A2M7JDR4_9BACT|nr:MAG: hypothetical protein COX18_07230 [Candidatus Desantisbacteria bacterium CG23_combo_of_CG06-09_8_20_14_all_40_23]PIX17496.1 MAG: hypothetical protein COZ71_02965 [Candidatus Desantisbacteria bacterium CG_4_8_14_3_um_filter_40_12]PJB29198.1 MAG: hypothetical protein CO110_07080 [Candidatus Desantisbacteria bacterium CG_4_9_14_3_um_filter_40_11]